MDTILADLNDEQRQAVTSTENYVRVVAGAGSGKTRALSHRFAFLVNELGILPGSILCATFTNKSAAEMRARIRTLTGDNDTGHINTFHGFCVSVLQEDIHAVQYPQGFLVLDNADIDQILQTVYDERGLTLRDMSFSRARDLIEQRKLVTEPEYYRDLITMQAETLKSKYEQAERTEDVIFYGYLYHARMCFGLDYNDLLKFVLFIFRENDEIRQKWQERLEYIMVDEFQDIDALQYELLDVLQGYHHNLFVVGDPDQTIYTWRGANVRFLLDFDQRYPETRTIMMTRNYRSTPQILGVANSLIAKNAGRIPKDLTAERPAGPPVLCSFSASAEREAQWIAGEIHRLQEAGIPLHDIAVLYRAHYLTRSIEDVFLRESIPYHIYSGTQFYARKEIKDALAYLRMLVYRDDLSFARIINTPRRLIGRRRMQHLRSYADERQILLYEALQENLETDLFRRTGAAAFIDLIEEYAQSGTGRPASEVLSDLLDKSGYEKMLRTEGSQERLDNLAELRQAVHEYELSCGEETTLESFLQHAALFTNADAGEAGGKVRLMTVHAAKGLEFPYVFLAGLNEGTFPSGRVQSPEGMEEERRLAFVALTRAEQGLYLSQASGRNHDGSWRYPSRFLLDIDPDLLEYAEKPPETFLAEARLHAKTLENRLRKGRADQVLNPGERVRHPHFGEGTVVARDGDRQAHIIQFDSASTPRAISCRARLERLQPAGK